MSLGLLPKQPENGRTPEHRVRPAGAVLGLGG